MTTPISARFRPIPPDQKSEIMKVLFIAAILMAITLASASPFERNLQGDYSPDQSKLNDVNLTDVHLTDVHLTDVNLNDVNSTDVNSADSEEPAESEQPVDNGDLNVTNSADSKESDSEETDSEETDKLIMTPASNSDNSEEIDNPNVSPASKPIKKSTGLLPDALRWLNRKIERCSGELRRFKDGCNLLLDEIASWYLKLNLTINVLQKFLLRFTPNRVQRWVLSLLIPGLAALQRILESARAFLHRPSDHQELIPENQAIPENEEIQENGEENQAIQENNEEEFDP